MAWARLDDQIADHPKFIAAGAQAAWLWVCGLTFSNRYLTDGVLTREQVRGLGRIKHALKLADRLVEVGLWERTAEGFRIHDYHDYQPTAAQVKAEREAARLRKQRQRGGHAPCPAGQGPDDGGSVRPDARARAHVGASRPTPGPLPAHSRPVPAAEATPEGELPEKTGRAGARGFSSAPPTGGESSGGGESLEALARAFAAEGLTLPALVGFEERHARSLFQHFTPDVIARCWADFERGMASAKRSGAPLSFQYLATHNRIGNWQREREASAVEDRTALPVVGRSY